MATALTSWRRPVRLNFNALPQWLARLVLWWASHRSSGQDGRMQALRTEPSSAPMTIEQVMGLQDDCGRYPFSGNSC
jgi:hypothetical protein